MPKGVYPRTPEHNEKLRQAKLKNPVRYWLGRTRSQEVKDAVSKGNKGNQAWNKGKPWSDEVKAKFSRAHKGKRRSPATEFKKGIIPWSTGRREGHNLTSYHHYIYKDFGRPGFCELCGSTKHLEWSNKDHKYNLKREDWQYLCRKCHMRYDYEKMGCRSWLYPQAVKQWS